MQIPPKGGTTNKSHKQSWCHWALAAGNALKNAGKTGG